MSSYTHFWGAVASVAATVLMVLRGIFSGASWLLVLGAGLFGLSLIALYTASSVYHFVVAGPRRLLRLRKLDHSMIYVLIAGSYTPVCLLGLRDSGGAILLAVVWAVGLLGMILTIAKLSIPRWLTSAIYLFMGWLAIFAIVPLHHSLPAAGFAWLLAGGLLYTVGGVLYAAKWPGRNNPRFGCHEIFHLFILLGSIAHFVMMYTVIAFL